MPQVLLLSLSLGGGFLHFVRCCHSPQVRERLGSASAVFTDHVTEMFASGNMSGVNCTNECIMRVQENCT